MRAWIVASAAGLLCAYCVGLVYEGFLAGSYGGLLTYPFPDKPAAERAYDRLTPATPGSARLAAARRLINADPANPESWTAVAYADRIMNRRLTPAGVQSLDHSYAVSFFDPSSAIWRVTFSLDNWAALTPELREDVLAEAAVVAKDPQLGPRLIASLRTVTSPEGRLAAAMLLKRPAP